MTQAPQSRALLRAGFAVVAFVLGVLGAEAVVRLYSVIGGEAGEELAKQDPMSVVFVPYGEYGYRQKPNGQQVFFNGEVAEWNGAGYRGPGVTLAKPPGTVRILLLGGSTTHGYGVANDETIDAHMRGILTERFPQHAFEVVNLALGGYDSYQVYERMKVDGVRYRPDIVIINSGINDVRNSRLRDLAPADPRTLLWEAEMMRLKREAQQGGPSWRTWTKHFFYLARLPSFASGRLAALKKRESPQDGAPPEDVPVYDDAQDYFERNIGATVELALDSGAEVLLSTPASSLLTRYDADATSDNGYWLRDARQTQSYRDALADRLKRLAQRYSASGRRVNYVAPQIPPDAFLDDCHLTSDGNRSVAEMWIEALEGFDGLRAARREDQSSSSITSPSGSARALFRANQRAERS